MDFDNYAIADELVLNINAEIGVILDITNTQEGFTFLSVAIFNDSGTIIRSVLPSDIAAKTGSNYPQLVEWLLNYQ